MGGKFLRQRVIIGKNPNNYRPPQEFTPPLDAGRKKYMVILFFVPDR